MTKHNARWERLDETKAKFELPAATLLYGEIVTEVRGEGKSSRY